MIALVRELSASVLLYFTFLSHLFPLQCGAGVRLKCYYAFSLVCCGYDTSFIVSVHIQCQASIFTLSLCRGHSWRVRLAKQETLTPPGHLTSGLQGSVNVRRGALLLVPQRQCIGSFVFYMKSSKRT